MSVNTMSDTVDIYAVASNASVVWDIVEHPVFEEFSVGLTALERVLGEDKDDDVWLEIRRVLRRARSTISATPLRFNHPALGLTKACNEVAQWVALANAQYSDEPVAMLNQLVSLLESIAASSDNPLGDKVVSLGSGSSGIGLLLPVARHKEQVLRFIRSIGALSGMEVVTPRELADRPPFAGLLVTGSLQWYRDDRHVVASPRAHVVRLLRWRWLRDSLPPSRLFAASRLGERACADQPPPASSSNRSLLDGRELVPRIDWSAVADKVTAARDLRPSDVVTARVLMLTGGCAVAVSETRGTVHVVEPELQGPRRIREAEVCDLEVGDFVLLRSQGGGDLVVEVANQILGVDATLLRALQREWKSALRAHVAASTYPSVAAQLRGAGALRANTQNLRNWMSPRSLKTANYEDFAGIMKLIGRAPDAPRFWAAMEKLDNAHRRAGHKIRQMLIKVVGSADLRQLEADGTMEFHLESKDGGRLTAFRVDAVAPDLVDIAEHRVGKLVEAGDLWLE